MSEGSYRAWGIVFALVGVLAFSFRPILIKLSYAAHPVGPVTLLFLRMTLSVPFFLAGGLKIVYDLALWRAFRQRRPPEERES